MIRPFLIITAALFIAAYDSARQELVLVRPDGLIDQEITENMVKLLGDESSVELVLTSDAMTGGDALLEIAEGRADLALISNDQPFRDDIATVMPLYATVLHIVFPDDRDPESFIDLMRNAVIFAGQPSSASRRVFERLTSTVDLGDEGVVDVVLFFHWRARVFSRPRMPCPAAMTRPAAMRCSQGLPLSMHGQNRHTRAPGMHQGRG